MNHHILWVGLPLSIQRELRLEFEKEHFEVWEEKSTRKALARMQSHEISVVLVNQRTSDAKERLFVRKCSKLLSHPSIIVLTPSRSAQEIRELFAAGAHDCLLKPFKVSHLLHSVKRGLERRKARIYGIKDPLTGLYNRYFFKDMLRSEIDRALRYDRHLSLLMIDIDHFKRLNDKYGHVIGDQILMELSEILIISFRKTDIITRFGGEEFAIILPETTLGHATMLAERIRKKIETHHYANLAEGEVLTVSIGISNYHTPGEHLTRKSDMKLIHSADKALYAAKKEGRNRVCISVPVTAKQATP